MLVHEINTLHSFTLQLAEVLATLYPYQISTYINLKIHNERSVSPLRLALLSHLQPLSPTTTLLKSTT